MKLTNKKLIVIIDNLNYLGNKRLPQKISYAITKNLLTLTNHYKCYEQELGKILAHYNEHAKTDESGNKVMDIDGLPLIEDEKTAKAMKDEVQELLNIEIDVDIHYIDESILDYEDSERYDALTPHEVLTLTTTIVKQEEETDGEENAEEVESL